MSPGQSNVYRFKYSPNRVLAGEEYTNSSGNIKGFTIYTMMVIFGVPVDNNAMTCSTSNAKIDFVTRKSYRFKAIAPASTNLNSANNLAVMFAATENTMNVDTGAAVTYSAV